MNIFLYLFLFSVSAWPQDKESEALKAARLGCDKQNQALGCYVYANWLIKIQENQKADTYFEKACKLNLQDGCDKKIWEPKKDNDSTTKVTLKSESSRDGVTVKIEQNLTSKEFEQERDTSQKLVDAIKNCEDGFALEQKHPMMKAFTIQHKVAQSGEDCVYTQTMPGNGLMNCKLNSEHRKRLAAGTKETLAELTKDDSICSISGY